MATSVRILETFEVVTQLGELVVHELRTGVKTVVDGPRERKTVYPKGRTTWFRTKKDAQAFARAHPGKVELVPKCARCKQRDVAYAGAVYCGAACSAQAEAKQ